MERFYRYFTTPAVCSTKPEMIVDPSGGNVPDPQSESKSHFHSPWPFRSAKETAKPHKLFRFATVANLKKRDDSRYMELKELSATDTSPTKYPPVSSSSKDNIVMDIMDPSSPPPPPKPENAEDDIPPRTTHSFHEETQYLNLVRDIIQTGSYEKSRNGNTYTKFGYTMRFSLKDGMIPLLTAKRLAWKTCFQELFWFISGSTSNDILREKNVNIWNNNASREFLDSRGLYHLCEGDLGPIYGHQWRHFNAEYSNASACYHGEGIDQLKMVIDDLSNPETRNSRRIIMTAWNPCQISQMALPPCHVMVQFHVRDNKYLSCALFQRSGDVGLGVPFNIASYSLLTHILAKHCGLEADEFVHFLGNCHIYEEHVAALKVQLERTPFIFPRISIYKKDAIEDYNIHDITWTTPYHYHDAIQMPMKA